MIAGFVGANGSGKTLFAVDAALRLSKRFPKRPIISTVPLEVPQYVALTSWQQIVKAEPPYILLLDEVAVLADARSTLTLPPHVIVYIGTMRQYDVVCFWTAPAWNWADIRLRAVTTQVNEMTPTIGVQRKEFAWKQTIVAMQNTRACNNEQGDQLPPRKGFPRFRVLPWARSYGKYPTRRDVMAMSEFAGVCATCGLKKRRRDSYCTCKANSEGITSIASSSAREVPAVKPLLALTDVTAGAERVPGVGETDGLDGLDGGQ